MNVVETKQGSRQNKDIVIYGWAAIIGVFLLPLIISPVLAVAAVVCGYAAKKRGRDLMGVAIMASAPAAILIAYLISLFITINPA
ncbi:hypothetical protein HGI30_10080 [Paenibacillus albicereus]|uniref:DUF4190 domain-containing protein n=1 Tax=Paenibacillus albicereus TaxID=2726185 RepID=A0A6H2GWU4_9BACL|nr:hypothetical protein [Paenibacillus albicereus]QJC51862.1 hypothetical protein HGI30_10080 [Paenibacillus albicereus]